MNKLYLSFCLGLVSLSARAEITINGASAQGLYDQIDRVSSDSITRKSETTITNKPIDAIYYYDLLRCGKIHNRVYPQFSYFCEIRNTSSININGEIKDGFYYGPQPFMFSGGSAQTVFDRIAATGKKNPDYKSWDGVSGTTHKPTVFNSIGLIDCHRSQGKVFKNEFGWYCTMPNVNPYDTNINRTTSDDDDR